MKAVEARITGRVQGVWFRAWTEEQATRLGVSGWVRNCRDGSVEACFAGPDEAVDALLSACRQGPPGARVNNIEVRDASAGEAPDGFEIRR